MGNTNLHPSLAEPTNAIEQERTTKLVSSFSPFFSKITIELLEQDPNESFPFTLSQYISFAKLALKHHSHLAELHRKAVPSKFAEERFWRNYFFHLLNLMKQARSSSSTTSTSSSSTTATSATNVEEIEQTLLIIRECFVYRIPPLKNSSGHFCKNWNLETPFWTGLLHIIAKGPSLFFRLIHSDETTASGQQKLFAQSRSIQLNEVDQNTINHHVEPTLDSSRYFVIRVQNPQTKQEMSLGIGFRERSTSFDFNATITDRLRQVRRQLGLESREDNEQYDYYNPDDSEDKDNNANKAKEIPVDLSLHEGQTISIKLKGVTNNDDTFGDFSSSTTTTTTTNNEKPKRPSMMQQSLFRLAPPPPAPSSSDDSDDSTTKSSNKKSSNNNNNNSSSSSSNKNNSDISSLDALADSFANTQITNTSSASASASASNTTNDEDEWTDFM